MRHGRGSEWRWLYFGTKFVEETDVLLPALDEDVLLDYQGLALLASLHQIMI